MGGLVEYMRSCKERGSNFLSLFLHRKLLHPFHFYLHSFSVRFYFSTAGQYIHSFAKSTFYFQFNSFEKMVSSISLLLTSVALSFASPLEKRAVTALNPEAFEEAQQKDDTATRAFSGTEIKVSACS